MQINYSFYRWNDRSNRIKWETRVTSKGWQFMHFLLIKRWARLIRIICIAQPTGACRLYQPSKSAPDAYDSAIPAHFPHSIWQQRLWPSSTLDWGNFETVLYGRRHPMRQGKTGITPNLANKSSGETNIPIQLAIYPQRSSYTWFRRRECALFISFLTAIRLRFSLWSKLTCKKLTRIF